MRTTQHIKTKLALLQGPVGSNDASIVDLMCRVSTVKIHCPIIEGVTHSIFHTPQRARVASAEIGARSAVGYGGLHIPFRDITKYLRSLVFVYDHPIITIDSLL